MMEWLNIKNRTPCVNSCVLTWNDCEKRAEPMTYESETTSSGITLSGFFTTYNKYAEDVVYWMPMPDEPNESNISKNTDT